MPFIKDVRKILPGESEDEDDQLDYYGADEDHASADEAAPEVAEPLYTRYPIVARRAWPTECVARVKVVCKIALLARRTRPTHSRDALGQARARR